MGALWKPFGSSTFGNVLTLEQRQLYAKETLFNFRWIAKFLASHSFYVFTRDDLAPYYLQQELAELGEHR